MNVKERVALGSIVASAGLAAAKAAVGLLTGSLAILSEAGHSLIDLSATVLTYFAVRLSGKPADKEHQYGHGKVESVTALAETALLFLLSAIVIWEAARRLIVAQTHAVDATVAAFAIIACSIVVDFFRARTLRRVARETSSEALEADALHFGSDMWSSVAVLIGLCGVALGYSWADATAAIVVAVFICVAGWGVGRAPTHRYFDRHGARRCQRARYRDRAASARRRQRRASAGAAGRRGAVRRSRRRGEPHAAARPRLRHQRPTDARRSRRTAPCRDHHHH